MLWRKLTQHYQERSTTHVRQRQDRALERFRRSETVLYHEEGGKLYSDEEHERRMEALLADFDREKDKVIADADRTIQRAERRTLALEHHDLSDSLTTTELERASLKRSYVEDDVWNLPLEDLLRRVRAAHVAGDKPTMFLYARTLQRCVDIEYGAGNVNERTAKDVRELEERASALTQAVRGEEAERELERARKAIRDANSLKLYAAEARRKADGTEDRLYAEAQAYIRGQF